MNVAQCSLYLHTYTGLVGCMYVQDTLHKHSTTSQLVRVCLCVNWDAFFVYLGQQRWVESSGKVCS